MSFYHYRFESPIREHSMGFNKSGELFYTVLFLPAELNARLPLDKYPRLRVEGEMGDIPFAAALQPAKGLWYLLVSRKFMKERELNLGDLVDIRFNVADQDHIEMPDELQKALDGNAEALKIWDSFTPGKKRGYAAQVSGAKQAQTRVNRAAKMIGYILGGKNAGGRSV